MQALLSRLQSVEQDTMNCVQFRAPSVTETVHLFVCYCFVYILKYVYALTAIQWYLCALNRNNILLSVWVVERDLRHFAAVAQTTAPFTDPHK